MRRNGDERGPAGEVLHAGEHFEPVSVWKFLIEQHQIPLRATFEHRARLFRSLSNRDVDAGAREQSSQAGCKKRLVFDE
jgi:hypothetical protein